MLQINVPATELYDEATDEFKITKSQILVLQHSLVSVSKWESMWKKPFLTREKKTIPETVDYIRCMTITQNVDPIVYNCITNEMVDQVSKYIENSMTATTFSKDTNLPTSREIITSEIIYYWMIERNIPFECEKWHLNRLLTLINVCSIKSKPTKKIGKKALTERNRNLNAARRAALNTSG